MKQIMKDPVLHFTSALVSALKWTFWIGMGLCALILIASIILAFIDQSADVGNDGVSLGYLTVLMAFATVLCFLFARFFKILRSVIDSVGLGSPLSAINAEKLLQMAKLLGMILVLGLIMDAGFVHWLPADEGCENSNFDIYYDIVANFFLTLLPILLLVILARIFHLGAAMREELEGTV
jgi:hypothetical protein